MVLRATWEEIFTRQLGQIFNADGDVRLPDRQTHFALTQSGSCAPNGPKKSFSDSATLEC